MNTLSTPLSGWGGRVGMEPIEKGGGRGSGIYLRKTCLSCETNDDMMILFNRRGLVLPGSDEADR